MYPTMIKYLTSSNGTFRWIIFKTRLTSFLKDIIDSDNDLPFRNWWTNVDILPNELPETELFTLRCSM